MGITYRDAGVNIEMGNETIKRIKKDVESTFSPEVLTGLGGFGSLYVPDLKQYKEPVLVSGTDGVGTKLKIAFLMDKHDTVGIDLVAMCVNDILAQGAKPLFFLDYFASGQLEPDKVQGVISGIAEGCRQADCSLVGGETAELPGFYQKGEYDLAGFAVGIVEREKIITGERISVGDKIIGIASSGIHSNGYSLVRKVFLEIANYNLKMKQEGFNDILGEVLLTPTKIYVKPVLDLLTEYDIRGIAHITGGGLVENIPRILPDDMTARIEEGSWQVDNVFLELERVGRIKKKEMFRTFNMGIGMILVVPEGECEDVLTALEEKGEDSYLIGEIIKGDQGIIID